MDDYFIFYLAFGIAFIIAMLYLFFTNIIFFEATLASIILGVYFYKHLHIHPVFSILLALAAATFFISILGTRYGFWIIGLTLSFFWALFFMAAFYGTVKGDRIWLSTIFLLSFALFLGLHVSARDHKMMRKFKTLRLSDEEGEEENDETDERGKVPVQTTSSGKATTHPRYTENIHARNASFKQAPYQTVSKTKKTQSMQSEDAPKVEEAEIAYIISVDQQEPEVFYYGENESEYYTYKKED